MNLLSLLGATTYNYSYNGSISPSEAAGLTAGIMLAAMLPSLIVSVVMLVAMWKVFTKANKPGWHAIIPFLNYYDMVEIAGEEGWKFLFFLIPLFNIYWMIKMYIQIAKKFGKETWFGILMLFLAPIMFCILAFDKKTVYEGAAAPVAGAAPEAPKTDPWVNGQA